VGRCIGITDTPALALVVEVLTVLEKALHVVQLEDVRVVVHPLRGDANDADALEAILVSALDNIRHPKSSSQPG
jgi:hypothetical protein